MTLYTDLLAAGCKIDHHETDLYVEASPRALEVIRAHGKRVDGWNAQRFKSQIDGSSWLDIPFAYDPAWNAKP